MKAERWRRIDELFEAALEREGAARAAFLEEACAGDEGLRREVEELLRIDAGERNLLGTPVAGLAARLISEEGGETVRMPQSPSDSGRKSPGRRVRSDSHTSDSIDDARFVPGDVLAGRYRVAGLLGRGGMGEVYRADDLKLKQSVALKFLPESLAGDGAALARFYQEVSVARQISHRHVCRVYDVGESAGQHFLSMEFVRGEELSSLLKRIGRLPPDKALETARQLCAGLAAVHEKGVLHRDLKPANVMIDERGDVRITDFGIATLADEARARGATPGTPAYMSPEQLEGRGLTHKSDIYSLGLVLYELFTGKRAFDAASLPELLSLRRSDSTPTSPSSIVKDLDPLIERVIFRCLERDPDKRPASALQVAAALPGGDPLAAALAAGETPSPEMVAAAPKEGVLRPARAALLLACVLAGLALVTLISGRAQMHQRVPLTKSAEALRERAAEITRRAGYREAPADSAHGFSLEYEYLTHLRDADTSPDRWDKLATGRPPLISFWHRQSPHYLEATTMWRVEHFDPPNDVSGMVLVKLDTTGRLNYFEAVPPQQPAGEQTTTTAPTDWSALLQEAGLDPNSLRSVAPRWTPPRHADARAAGEVAADASRAGDAPVRVEAASYQGRPVYFEVVHPWQKPTRQTPLEASASDKAETALLLAFYFGALALGVLLAWRNLRLGRGDRRGAFRLALYVFAVRVVYWVFETHHVPTANEVGLLLHAGLRSAAFWALFVGLMYLALEPFLRRRWPEWVISWSRLLAGNFRDPLVGRDILIGGALGVGYMVSNKLGIVVPKLLGWPTDAPALGSPLLYTHGLRGLDASIPLLTNALTGTLMFSFILFALLLFFAMLLRRKWLGIAAAWLLVCALHVVGMTAVNPVGLFFVLVASTTVIVAAARFGLLALISLIFFIHLSAFYPVTTELSAWYASTFILGALLLVALALYGFYTSLAGQPLFREGFLDD